MPTDVRLPPSPVPPLPSAPAGRRSSPRHARWAATVALAALSATTVFAATPKRPEPKPPADAASAPPSSTLDAPLLYQLLLSELQWTTGQPAGAYQLMLDAARRTRDEQLYQRATEMALQQRAGDDALAAARAWVADKPDSARALRHEAQILIALGRPDEAQAALSRWLAKAPTMERAALLQALPRMVQGWSDKAAALRVVQRVATPWRDATDARTVGLRTPARVAMARAQAQFGDPALALADARAILADDPKAADAALLAMTMWPQRAEAAAVVQGYLAQADADPRVRLAWVRQLAVAQRLGEAQRELEVLTTRQPTLAAPWLTLGALRLEQRDARGAEAALERFLALTDENAATTTPAAASAPRTAHGEASADDEDDDGTARPMPPAPRAVERNQARMMLAQAAQQRGDRAAAERWLAQIDDPRQVLEVQMRRALPIAQQGRVDEARALLRGVPEAGSVDARAKAVAEAQLMRELKRWDDAAAAYERATALAPDDIDLLYERAMVEEKRNRLDAMERLLRDVIAGKPDHAHAHNALGYSLAERGLRLAEAQALIERAIELSPGDPFILDSLGWVHFKRGRLAEATKVLRQAYEARPDAEIAAHLGEVLWVGGQRDDARRVWREAQQRDAQNEALRETLGRLGVGKL